MRKLEAAAAIAIIAVIVVVALGHVLLYGLAGICGFILGIGVGDVRATLRHNREIRRKRAETAKLQRPA